MITRFSPALFSFPPTISHPPCLLLAPTPVREHSGMGGIDGIDGIHFAPRIFSLTLSPTLSPFFIFWRGSMETMPSMAAECVLNSNLTDGSKTKVCQKVWHGVSNLCHSYPHSVSEWRSERGQNGCRRCCGIDWWHSLGGEVA